MDSNWNGRGGGNRGNGSGRSNMGFSWGRPGGSGFSFFPPAIKFLLVSNIAVYLLELLFGQFHFGDGGTLEYYTFKLGALWPIASKLFYPWQVITYMFMHEGLTHILFNMFALWMFGVEVEQTWGTKKFLTYYVLCGLGGAAAHLMLSAALNGVENGPLVGASGAIFGVLVAFGLLFPNRSIYFYFLIPIPAKYFIGLYIGLEVYAVGASNDNVSHLAHLGGAVTGIIYLLITTGGRKLSERFRNPNASGAGPWSGSGQSRSQGSIFQRPARGERAVDAEYYDVDDRLGAEHRADAARDVKQARVITQEEVDRILDKIAATGYQNLTEEEREILFEASRRMEERR